MSPYRTPATPAPTAGSSETEEPCPDADLRPVFVVLWLGSGARVVIGIADHEIFGAEGTLALLAVLIIPYLSRRRR